MKTSFCSLAAAAAVATSLAVAPATATRTMPPPTGGGDEQAVPQTPSMRVEVLPGRITVELLGPGARPLASEGASGKAVLDVNGHQVGVALQPAGGNLLVGQAPFVAGDSVVAEVTVSVAGRVLTARYEGL
ncbi:MAG: hypothetical protein ACM33T_04770 [Solirubrobacterales bacterium]